MKFKIGDFISLPPRILKVIEIAPCPVCPVDGIEILTFICKIIHGSDRKGFVYIHANQSQYSYQKISRDDAILEML